MRRIYGSITNVLESIDLIGKMPEKYDLLEVSATCFCFSGIFLVIAFY
jgi:hypothetical protein